LLAHSAGKPSSVVIDLPVAAATGQTQERISFPLSSTEHAPHCARPHPKRGPMRWSSLRKTYNNGVSLLAGLAGDRFHLLQLGGEVERHRQALK
jgi:hypothetical protein